MNAESAKQYLMDLGLDRSQPEDRMRAFLEWRRQATAEELAALDDWHQEWLIRQRDNLDSDTGMLDRNRKWLERQVSASIQAEQALWKERDPGPTPVNYLLRWAAAAAVVGAIATGAYFSVHRHSSTAGTAVPREGLIAGAVLTLSDGRKQQLENIPVGTTITDSGLRIVKPDSGTIRYDHPSARGKGGTNALTTAEGKQYCVVLSDGSRVWLNSSATLTYPSSFSGADRTVQLSGEGYFEIQPNAAAPFKVRAPGMDVQVLGTRFDVMAYPDETSVRATLIDGLVAVSRGDQRRTLQPGEQAVAATGIGDSGVSDPGGRDPAGQLSVVKASIEEVLAWRRGEFRFKKVSIVTIMRQLARWYDVTVDYSGPVSTALFSGVITRKETVTQLLEGLEISGDVHFMVRGKSITVFAGSAKTK